MRTSWENKLIALRYRSDAKESQATFCYMNIPKKGGIHRYGNSKLLKWIRLAGYQLEVIGNEIYVTEKVNNVLFCKR